VSTTSTEYKTIRVHPDVYDRAVQLREAIRLRSIDGIPEIAQDSAKISLGRVINAGLALLEREVGATVKKETDDDE